MAIASALTHRVDICRLADTPELGDLRALESYSRPIEPLPQGGQGLAVSVFPGRRAIHLAVVLRQVTLHRSTSVAGMSMPPRAPCMMPPAAITPRGIARTLPLTTSQISSLYAVKLSFLSASYQTWVSRYF